MGSTRKIGQLGRALLYMIGVIMTLAGIGISLYSILGLRPRVAAVNHQAQAALLTLDRAASALSGGSRLLSGPLAALEAGGQLARQLPETLLSLKGTLFEASDALVATGKTAHQAGQGIAGLVTPGAELGATNAYLQATAEQLRLLAAMVGNLAASSSGVAGGAAAMTRGLAQVREKLGPAADLIGATQRLLRASDQSLGYLDLPLQVMLLGLALGGLYLTLGIFCVGMGMALPVAASVAAPAGREEASHLRRAA